MIIGNVTPAAVSATTISASGNITGNFFLGNGSQLTGLPATYSNANVTSLLANFGSNTISTTGNIQGGNVFAQFNFGTSGNVNAGTVSASGNITAGNILGGANVNATTHTGATVSVTGNITGGNVNTGAVSASGTITGNAISAIGNVQALGNVFAINNIAANGNLTAGINVSATGNVIGNYFIGNGSQLTGVTATSANTANAAVFLRDASNAAINMNIDAALFQVNLPGGAQINYGGDGVDPLSVGSINLIGTQANLANSYAQLTFVNQANFVANPLSLMRVSNAGPIMSYDGLGVFGGTKQFTINSAGASTNTSFSATGNVTGGNIRTAGQVSATGNVSVGNLVVTGNIIDTGALTISTGSNGNIALAPNGTGQVTISSAVSATGNVTGNFFIGNGSQLTGLPATYGNANVAANLAAFGSNPISTTGNVTAGNLRTAGVVSATGNVTGNYFIGNGSQLTGITAISSNTANAAVFLVANANPALNMSIDSANFKVDLPGGGIMSFSGFDATTFGSIDFAPPQANIANAYVGFSHFTQANIFATPVNTVSVGIGGVAMLYDAYNTNKTMLFGASGLSVDTPFSATGNVTGGNLRTSGQVSATGNVSVGNLLITGNIVDTGALTILTSSNGNIALTPNGTGQVTVSSALSVSGNITGGNINTAGAVSTTGRVIGVNYTESVNAIGNSGGTISPNISLGSIQSVTLTSNLTFNTITNIQAGQSFTFIITQDGTGSRTLTSTMKFASGFKTLSTAANATDIISVFYNGTTYYASLTQGYA
jgi:hypothetical protein